MMFTPGKAATMGLLSTALIVFTFLSFFWTKDIRNQSNACYGTTASVNAIVDVYHSLAKTSYQLALSALILTLISSAYFTMASHPEMFRFFETGIVTKSIGFLAATGSIITHLFLVALVNFNTLKTARSSYMAMVPGGTCSFSKVNQLVTFEWINFAVVIAIIIIGHMWSHGHHHKHSLPVAQDCGRVYTVVR